MKGKISVIVCTLILLGLVIVCVRAADDASSVDQIFENARGQLLAFYSSEVVSHSAIILGLIVAFPSIGAIAWRRLKDKERLVSFQGVLIFVFIIMLVLYSLGGLIYWSALGAALIGATRSTDSINIISSNVTYCIKAMTDYTNSAFISSTRFSLNFTSFSPLNFFAWIMRPPIPLIIMAIILLVAIIEKPLLLSITSWRIRRKIAARDRQRQRDTDRDRAQGSRSTHTRRGRDTGVRVSVRVYVRVGK
jgi:uncharacterized Tic20 family protein